MHSPNVSGALTYKELVMASKNGEGSELKKMQAVQLDGVVKVCGEATHGQLCWPYGVGAGG